MFMNPQELHNKAREIAMTLNGSYEDYPFGEEHCVFRIEGKIFIFISTVRDKKIVTLKLPADQVSLNIEIFKSIRPGYHMNKKYWITIEAGNDITKELLSDLIISSYKQVLKKLPKNKRNALLGASL